MATVIINDNSESRIDENRYVPLQFDFSYGAYFARIGEPEETLRIGAR